MSDDRLSQIVTMWSMVRRAHQEGVTDVCRAQQALLERYGGAVHRYARAALRSEDAADEVFQEFSLKFVRGDFGGADPAKGRFRSFVKTVVYRLVVDYQRKKKRLGREVQLQTNIAGQLEPDDDDNEEELFRSSWRDELLARCWTKLEEEERESGKPYYTALRHRVEHPDMRSPELATGIGEKLGKPITAGNARVLLHRARDKFAELLLVEVLHSLEGDTPDETEQELIELDLLEYCRPALQRRRHPSPD